ncbi:hypothetical protein BOX15_Mlig004762g1 [Macrostomum lignano]|uniref:MAGUK p55 subfamily member 5 n=2 Tax=Macrostomum lignano TaxID=282301 RepID=A0A267GK69_9PLAT|nr:hypothetical protein BOX15_Mlig004762g1 [Macrostomum lignano]
MAAIEPVASNAVKSDGVDSIETLASAAVDDVNRRRQEAQRRQAEADFLGGSLRDSERLRALTVNSGAIGRDNPAFSSERGTEFDSPRERNSYIGDAVDDLEEDDVGDIGDFLRQLRSEDPEGYYDDDEGSRGDRLVPDWLAQFLTSPRFSAIYGLARRVSDAVNAAVFGDQDAFRGGNALTCTEAVSSTVLPGDDRERIELLRLLNEPHLVALMKVHDGAAARAVPLEDHLPGVEAPNEAEAAIKTNNSTSSSPQVSDSPSNSPDASQRRTNKPKALDIELEEFQPNNRLATSSLLAAANIHVTVTAPTPSPSASPSARSAASTSDDNSAEVQSPPVPRESLDCRTETVVQDGVQFRRVTLVKSDSPLGATVKNVGDSVVVSRIVCGGLLDRIGDLIGEGDELISVNGIDLTGKHVNEVYDLLQSLSGRLVFLTVPCTEYRPTERNNNSSSSNNNNNNVESSTVLRALFTYEPSEDLYNPCREAGLEFQVGDLIRVLNTKDPNWWQGVKEMEAATGLRPRQESARSLAGLFPSPDFQRRRQLMLSMAAANAAEATADASSSSCCWRCQRCLPLKRFGIRAGRRRQDNRYAPADLSAGSSGSSSTSGESDTEADVVIDDGGGRNGGNSRKRHRVGSLRRQKRRHRRRFFEPQALLQPQPFRRRPLVLVGPPGVGRHELRVRLIESDPARFAPALLHTTRQRRQDETDGVDFEFTTRQEFQRRIREGGHFLETGQFNGDLYGTSVANVTSVVESGSVCVLTMQPAGLRAIRRHPARLMPYSVFVSPPPSLNGLRALRRKLSPSGAEVAPEDSDADLRKLIDLSRRMEEACGHLVDRVLVNTDLSASVAQLVGMVTRLEREPQWVPASWLQPPAGAAARLAGSEIADTAC